MDARQELSAQAGSVGIGAHLARLLLHEWLFEEIHDRCLILGVLPRMSEAEIVARRARDLSAAEAGDEDSVQAWIAGLFRSGEMTGAPVDDRALLSETVRAAVGAETFGPEWAELAADFVDILHPGRSPADLGVRRLRRAAGMLVDALEMARKLEE